MARKSAASAKIKAVKPELPPIEETWENAKQAFINTAEVSIVLAKRVDNLLNLRDMYYSFYKTRDAVSMDKLMELRDLSVKTYEKILEVVKTFEMEEFVKDEMKDYFEDIIPKCDDLKNEDDLLEAAIVFLSIKPYGEKMTALHHTMVDERKQREYNAKGE